MPQRQLITQSGLPVTGEVVVETTTEVIPQATTSSHDHEYSSTVDLPQQNSDEESLFELPPTDETVATRNDPGDELTRFMREKLLPRTECPLLWWKANGYKYLSVPASSAPSERVFSVAGVTVNRLRSALSPEHVQMLVALHCNQELL